MEPEAIEAQLKAAAEGLKAELQEGTKALTTLLEKAQHSLLRPLPFHAPVFLARLRYRPK